jgi:fucose permease
MGLPDPLLGSSWPLIYRSLGTAEANAGIIMMVITGGTIVACLLSDRAIKKAGTGLVAFLSVVMTGSSLWGFSLSGSFVMLCLVAFPYGLGTGSLDAALTNFVALHYKARHMNWMHCFWGAGAAIGPVVMSYCLTHWNSWHAGYRTVSAIQLAFSAVLLISLPLWKRARVGFEGEKGVEQKSLGVMEFLKMPAAKATIAVFFFYCGIELTTGLWGATYLVSIRNIPPETAAKWISFFYIGITLGRFFAGFLTIRLSHGRMMGLSYAVIGTGLCMMMIFKSGAPLMACLLAIGLGYGPVFPCMLHQTPKKFGKEHSQSIVGIQMACAYAGSMLVPPVFGFLGARTGYGIFPVFLSGFGLIVVALTISIHRSRVARSKS